jgi:hypothetical protein
MRTLSQYILTLIMYVFTHNVPPSMLAVDKSAPARVVLSGSAQLAKAWRWQ